MAKAKGEWARTLLKEVVLSNSEVWRAEKSTAPDGTEFVSIRRVLVKKDGSVVYLNGVSAPVGDRAASLLAALRVLLPVASKANTSADEEPKSSGRYALAQGAKLLVNVEYTRKGGTLPVVVTTAKSERQPKTFAKASSAKAFREERLSQETKRWRIVRFDPVEYQTSKG